MAASLQRLRRLKTHVVFFSLFGAPIHDAMFDDLVSIPNVIDCPN